MENKGNEQGSSAYEQVADKVGFVPNLRKKDNIFQAICAGTGILLGLIIGFFVGGLPMGVILGGLCGFVAGGFIGGLVLMFVGLTRK